MAILRSLILVNMGFLLLLGFWTIFSEPVETVATMRALGAALVGLAVVLWVSSALSLVSDQRRLALLLSFANGLLAATALLQQAIWGSPLGRFLILIPLSLAAALAWMGLKPVKPGEAAAELGALRIPDEIRQALLQQIGEAAAQEERNRLARDLHDSIKQQLFSINVGTATAQERWERDPEGAVAALADVRRSAREAMVEMQALLHHLRPESLGSIKGFVEALREQCEALRYRSGAEVTVELGEEIPDDRLPPGTPEALFRIAQEALANVARHARARQVRVRLGLQGEAVVLEVVDDGQGFDRETASPGMGLRNLRERAESLGGKLELASEPGGGTRISARIPLTPTGADQSPFRGLIRVLTRDSIIWVQTLLLIFVTQVLKWRFASLFILAIEVGLMVFLAGWMEWRARKSLSRHPDAALSDIAAVRYRSHLCKTLLLLGAAGMSYVGALRMEKIGSLTWTPVWMSISFLCLALVVFEGVRAYRLWRRPRPAEGVLS